MRGIKKAVSLILSVLIATVSALSLISCKRSYKEDEVVAAARELLPKAHTLYSIYYGNGLGYISTGYSDGDYREADPVSLRRYDLESIDELKAMTKATFSEEYSRDIFNKYLESYEANDTVYSYARYTENATGEYILVYKNHDPIFDDRMEYDLDTVTDIGSNKKFVKMSVEATVKNDEGESKRITLEFTMFEEALGWKISSPCFGNYR